MPDRSWRVRWMVARVGQALEAAGVRCVVAWSKIERPPDDRVKNRSPGHRAAGAAAAQWGEGVPGVRVPNKAEEAVLDLVRAGEDVRGDLMRARHRLSKLLLRQGSLWESGAWTHAHECWLRSLTFDKPGVRLACDDASDAGFSTRWDRLDTAITEMGLPPSRSRPSWPGWGACAEWAR